ncbi:BTB/POZ domain-containing protein 9-like [Adelges cooleyi]|uniref:BTB/POZ domain-containing protein 9-like n=1 Tax=Adelges cooleyi TaxID=133065 RepID=UPI0021806CFC|nr:BTB/POZ domain-containing protein 9-like [Adelges cooleyi]XP_050441028.1 BTB/POZ domain-containing protein 9-like [Adelges cooleyi]
MNLSVLEGNVILELLILSNMWCLTNLQFSLSEYLCNNINIHNVSSLFVVALYYQLKELEVASINFIVIHILDVLKSIDSSSLSAEELQLILNSDLAFVNELDIFREVCQWIKNNQDHLHPDDKTNILSAIRYQLMNNDELSEVRRSELVFSDTIILDVIKKSLTQKFNDRGRFEPNVNFARENSIELSQIDGCTMIALKHPSNINYIEMKLTLLWPFTHSYYIEVSVDMNVWLRVVDHSSYDCRSIQRLWINPIYVRYIRVVGTSNTSNKPFEFLKVMYNTDNMHLVEIKNRFVAPKYNVALLSMNALVIKGSFFGERTVETNNCIFNDDYKNYGEDLGYTFHFLDLGECIEIQLAQPYVLSSMRMLLWDRDGRTYNYTVQVSVNHKDWDMVKDKSNKSAQLWQLLLFEQRPVVYIRITGVRVKMPLSIRKQDKTFNLVYFEAPAQVSLDPKVTKPWKSISQLLNRK